MVRRLVKSLQRGLQRVASRGERVSAPRRRHVIDGDLSLGPEDRRESAAYRDWTRT